MVGRIREAKTTLVDKYERSRGRLRREGKLVTKEDIAELMPIF